MSSGEGQSLYEGFKQKFIHCIEARVSDPNFATDHQDDRIKFLLECLCDTPTTSDIPPLKENNKDAVAAIDFRLKGNSCTSLVSSKFDDSIESYSKSIAYAPTGSEELSLAYANRSHILFRAGLIVDCLVDIQRAFDNDCPNWLKSKLYFRRVTSLKILNSDETEVENALRETEFWMKDLKPKDHAVMKRMVNDARTKEPIPREIYSNWEFKPMQPNWRGRNRLVPGLSDAVELRYNQKYGRHIVAARDITPGETLGVAKPYVKSVFINMRYKLCWHCGQQTWTGIPCENCVEVIYCSDTCRQQDRLERHDYECPLLSTMMAFNVEDGFFMCMRLAIQALKESNNSIETLMENLVKIDTATNPLIKGFTNNVQAPDKYASIYGLMSNSVHWLRHQKLILTECFLIAYYLGTRTNFLGNEMSGDLCIFRNNEHFIFLVGLLEKNFCLNNTNSAEFAADYRGDRKNMFQMIIPAFAFFNHSCDLRVIRSPQQDGSVVMTSVAPVRRGQQIFDNYGEHFFLSSKIERQRQLQKLFHFTCYCRPCEKDYPMGMSLYSEGICTSQYAEMRRTLDRIYEKVSRDESVDPNDYTLARTKNHPPMDVSEELPRLIQIVEYFSGTLPAYSEEVLKATRCLEFCIRMKEMPYLTTDPVE